MYIRMRTHTCGMNGALKSWDEPPQYACSERIAQQFGEEMKVSESIHLREVERCTYQLAFSFSVP